SGGQDAGKELKINISHDGQTSYTEVVSKGTPYAGQSITVKEGESFKFNASSFTDGHAPTNTMDGNKDSYWESRTNQNEWLSTYIDSSSRVKNVKITWGNNYATKYNLYASADGVNYTKINNDVIIGDGGEDIIDLNNVYQYIKIEMLESSSTNYQIKEIEFEKYQNLSRNKPVTVSSVSTFNEASKKMVGPLAVDGNYSGESRWASKRGPNDNHNINEWIIVDLGQYSKIENVSIVWEGACSDDYDIFVSQDGKRWGKPVKAGLATNSNLKDSIDFDEGVYGRYVKISSNKTRFGKTNYGISIFELDVYGEEAIEPPIEVSYLQNAYASSNLPSANKVTDGSVDTYWQSETNGNEWIYLELKDIYKITEMTIKWGDTYATSYDIEVSNDTKNWKAVKEIDETGAAGEQTFKNFNNAQGRYVRLKLKESSGSDYKVEEVIIRGDLIEKDERANLALKKTAKASSEYNTYTKANLAVDGSFKNNGGNDQSRWVSNRNSNDEWIQVDLGDLYNVDRVKLYWEGQGASKYKLLASKDGINYTEVYEENNGEPGMLDIKLDKSVPARFIKMQGVKYKSQFGYSLWEFEVYGNDYNGENGTVNVAAYQPTAASTIDNQSIPANAVDNSRTSGFKSFTEKNPWLNVFLKDVYTISSAKVNFVTSTVNKYAIEVSMDGEDWETVKEITVEAGLSPVLVTFDEVDTRYVRIRVLDDADRVLEVKDFAVYGKLSEKIEDINIAAFKTSSASTENDSGKFVFESKYAFDESIESRGDSYQSRWVSERKKENKNADPNQWIQVNLGDYYDVSKVVLNWEGAYAKNYKLQTSLDGETWKDISVIDKGMAGVKQFNYKETEQAKYVRMYATA
ncbi:MAG: discoidin domain-containing protein, partial [Coprobacillus sp.]